MVTFVRLLGRPEIGHDSGTTPLRAEVRFRLFAVLALQAAPERRDWLAGLFWPERDNAVARRNLRKVVFDAGVFAWSGQIESTRETLGWMVATDVALFERALLDRRYGDALQLYRGQLLEGLDDPGNNEFSAFLDCARGRLAQRWRMATLARMEEVRDDPTAVLALANTLLGVDPLDEDAIAASLVALRATGNASDTVRLYRSYAERLREELGVEPAPRLRALACATASAPRTCRSVAGGAAKHEFIGRDLELRELAGMFGGDDCRLITIVGPGGIGKSRFAKAALAALESRFVDGIWWITLDDLERADQVVERIVQILGLDRTTSSDPLHPLTGWLQDRQALLVLDNAEAVTALAGLVDRLLAAAPATKVLATSRHRLGCAGEWLLPLAGLAMPPPGPVDARAAECDAVRLFETHARLARPAFDLSSSLTEVTHVVRALGGHPLAIELAAHWLRVLPIGALEAEIATSLDLLERDEEGDERPEHRSVRATFDSGWRMLACDQQSGLAMLSVFAGSFSRVAAKDVADVALPMLSALADRSLIHAQNDGRFTLHPLLRQFALEKCHELGLVETAADRHARWFHQLLEQRRDACAAGDPAALERIHIELANCHAAWKWSVGRRDTCALARTATPLMHFYLVRGRIGDGLMLFAEAAAGLDLDRRADQLAAAHVLLALARLQNKRGALRDAAETARRALKVARQLGLDDIERDCLEVLLASLRQRGLYPQARHELAAGLRRARHDEDLDAAASFLSRAAALDKAQGNHVQAQAHYAEALRCERRLGRPAELARLLRDIGDLHCVRGERQLAVAVFQEGLDLCERHGVPLGSVSFLLDLALAYNESGEFEAATRFCQRALERACNLDLPALEAAVRLVHGRLAFNHGDFDAAHAQVRAAAALTLDLADEGIGLDCVRSFAELLVRAGAVVDQPVAAALLDYVARHPSTAAADRLVARAQLKQLFVASAVVKAEPSQVAVGVLLRRIAADPAPVPAEGRIAA